MLFYFLLKSPSPNRSASKPENPQSSASSAEPLEDLKTPAEQDAAELRDQYQHTQANYFLERRIFW